MQPFLSVASIQRHMVYVIMRRILLLPAALLLGVLPSASAQSPGEVDLSFESGSFVNSTVYAVVPAGNGKVYIGGDFTTVRGAARNGVERLNADDSLDGGFNPGSGPNVSGVGSIALQPDGMVLIGGGFTSYTSRH